MQEGQGNRINRRSAGKTGTWVWLRMPHEARLVNHLIPESCLAAGNRRWEALTGVGVGQVLSFEKSYIGVPTTFLCSEGKTVIDAK